MEAFELYVQTHANLIDLFSSAATGNTNPVEHNRLFGFLVNPFRFVQMISFAGVQEWLIRFGRTTDDTTSSGGVEFCLILTGVDNQGNIITPNFQLIHPLFSKTALAEGNSEQSSTVVGVSLKQQWTESWANLMLSVSVPKHICQNTHGILKGYNFKQSDFLMTVDSLQSVNNEMIEFRIVNHYSAFSPASAQTNAPGAIGLMIGHVNGVANISGNGNSHSVVPPFTQKSYYYDISSPCPPTCPTGASQS